MSKLWGQIKDSTAIGVQFIKEKAGAATAEVDPAFEEACGRYEILVERLKTFQSDVEEILRIVPSICETGQNFSTSLVNADLKSGSHNAAVANSLDSFFKQSKTLVDQGLLAPTAPSVVSQIQTIRQSLADLDKIRAKRRKNQLLCDSLKSKMDALGKKGKPEDLTEARVKFELKREKLQNRTKQFIDAVDAHWTKRFEEIEKPLQAFIGILFSFSQSMFSNLQTLQRSISPQELGQALPAQ